MEKQIIYFTKSDNLKRLSRVTKKNIKKSVYPNNVIFQKSSYIGNCFGMIIYKKLEDIKNSKHTFFSKKGLIIKSKW